MSAMPFPRISSLLTPLLWVAAMFLCYWLCGVCCRTDPHGKGGIARRSKGSTSAKFDPEMEDKDGQNPI